MKKAILLLLLASPGFVHAQSLKDALFSGKLKNQPGTVIRKGDDLSTKMDTATHKDTLASGIALAAPTAIDSASKAQTIKPDSNAAVAANNKTVTAADNQNNTGNASSQPVTGTTTGAPAEATPAPKNNTVLWKEYMDSVSSALKTEALNNKKVKSGTYYATVSYEIGTDGQVNVTDVFLMPDNKYLQQQIKDRVSMDPPHLAPVLNSTGAPRKVTKKYNFTLTK
ncbi:MAG TPA: hypothetical protein VNS32_04355 [Flavisolibacter sp.]|nr:hypothetical protein [Flavisolibacter sp.]